MTHSEPPESKVAIVTGCGKRDGMGASIARHLASTGAIVCVTDAQETGVLNFPTPDGEAGEEWGGISELASEIEDAFDVRCRPLVGDVSVEKDTQRMVAEVIREFGHVDILVNNAAAPHGADFNQIDNVPISAFDHVVAVNLRGTFLMCQASVPGMRERKWGRIVNTSSNIAKTGRAKQIAYTSAKAGILALTRSLALEVAAHGVTVNAVCPGPVRTSRTESSLLREGIEDVEEGVAARAQAIPMGRWGTPDEIASTVRFLASDDASFITGQAINVDGGVLPV